MIKVDISHLKRNNLNKKKSIGNNLLPTENKKIARESIDISFELVKNAKLNKFLVDKSKELIGIQANARLQLGEIFQDVYDELAGSPHDGLYIKWLNLNGFNKMTALRHRNRFNIFKQINSSTSKSIIATLPQKTIDSILNYPDQEFILSKLEENITKNELHNIFSLAAIEKEIITPIINLNLETEYSNFKTKYEKLDISKLSKSQEKKLLKLLTSFEKIIESIN